MTREEKARWLSNFYTRVAEGEEMLLDGGPTIDSPDMQSAFIRWTTRKPKRGVWVMFDEFGVVPGAMRATEPDRPHNWVYMEEPDAHT